MWAAAVAIYKPFVLVWAGLNAIDDLALLIRVGRLGASIVPLPGRPRNDPAEMCGVCDDVMVRSVETSFALTYYYIVY